MRYTFTQHERLKREQHIETLFRSGKAFSSFPLKCTWLPVPRSAESSPVRMGISVPKKRIPRAVKRNRIKRLVRESWRLHKHILYTQVPEALQLHVFLVFTGQPEPDYATIEAAVKDIIDKLVSYQAPSHA